MSNAVADFHTRMIHRIGFAPISNIQITLEYGADALINMQRAVALGLARQRVVSTNSCGLLIIQYRLLG
jgi:hypothetical protein